MQRVAAGVPSANSRQTRIWIEEEGLKAPRAKWKRVSLSLSFSRFAVLCKYMCVLLLSLPPLRTKGCARCLLNEYYQSSEGGCCRRSAWRGEAVQEEFRGRGIPWSARLPRWEHALDRRKDPFGFRRAFQKTGGNRWTNSFREEGSNIFVTIIGIIVGKGVFKQFSVVWKFFRLSHDGLVGDIFHVNWMILRLLYFAIRIICTILLFVKIMFRVLILSRKKKERAHFTD